jgi:hypothetical protein
MLILVQPVRAKTFLGNYMQNSVNDLKFKKEVKKKDIPLRNFTFFFDAGKSPCYLELELIDLLSEKLTKREVYSVTCAEFLELLCDFQV